MKWYYILLMVVVCVLLLILISSLFYKMFFKRFYDIILSLVAIILLSPILGFVALLVRINLGSPIIFKQQRPGKNEKIFYMYKFRTMRDAREKITGKKLTDEERLRLIEERGEVAVTSDSERLTNFGRFLRKLSLDELPELFNILKGDMSIVGPRPLAVIYLPYYNEKERVRHNVLPGLTGLAQVNGRNVISWEKRFEYDIEYVEHVTLWQDIKIILKTIAVVFRHNDIGQGESRPESFCEIRQQEWDREKNKKTDCE